MEIDIVKAKKAFSEYVKNYDIKDAKIKLKINHIERVAEISKKIAEELKLSEEDVKLAQLIGLLHDIGRFEQIKKYHTFLDKDSINHGEYGCKILFDEGLIRKFIETDKYDKIIKIAIINHNRAYIEEGLTEKEQLHSKIIRDADKLDIFYVLTIEDKKVTWGSSDLSEDVVDDEIYKEFMQEKRLNYKNIHSPVDSLISNFAYVYDINFKQSVDIIIKNDYLEKIYSRFKFNKSETKEKMENVYIKARKYIEAKKED